MSVPTKMEDVTLEWLQENTPVNPVKTFIGLQVNLPEICFENFEVAERKPYGTWSEFYVRVQSEPLIQHCGIFANTVFKDVRIQNFGGNIKISSPGEPILFCWLPIHVYWEHTARGTNGGEWLHAMYNYVTKKWEYRNYANALMGTHQC